MKELPTTLYERERSFNKSDKTAPPRIGISLSGGGNRSAAFSIGALSALFERGILDKVDVISAVSGGSYALSWYLLQPYYYSKFVDQNAALQKIQMSMFDFNGGFQTYLENNAKPIGAEGFIDLFFRGSIAVVFDLGPFNALRLLGTLLGTSRAVESAPRHNASSTMRKEYREGIQNTYHILPDALTGEALNEYRLDFDGLVHASAHFLDLTVVPPVTFPTLAGYASQRGLPSFIFNTTVNPPHPKDNVTLSHRIFEISTSGFGSDSCGYLSWEETEGLGWEPGLIPEKIEMVKGIRKWFPPINLDIKPSPFAIIRNFNVAPAISGAALSGTNIGRDWTRWLLRLANIGLEYLVPNPSDLKRVVRLSDGGHSENLGAYALLRRECQKILIIDAEHDPSYSFDAYRLLKERSRQELGIELEIPSIESGTPSESEPIYAGLAKTSQGSQSTIYYLKLSMNERIKKEHAEINQYASKHDDFPQESTADQYFQPAQFKAYRALGYAIAKTLPSL